MSLKAIESVAQRRALISEREEHASDAYGPWLSAQSAAKFLDFGGKNPVKAFYMWAKRHGVVPGHRGSRLLFAKADLERAIGASRHGKHRASSIPLSKVNSVSDGGR